MLHRHPLRAWRPSGRSWWQLLGGKCTAEYRKVLCSRRPWPMLIRARKAARVALTPILELYVVRNLYEAGDPIWAFICLVFLLLPYVALYTVYKCDIETLNFISSPEERFEAFVSQVSWKPHIPGLILLDLRIATNSILEVLSLREMRPWEQTYNRLRLLFDALFSSFPNGIFKAYMAIRLVQLDRASFVTTEDPCALGVVKKINDQLNQVNDEDDCAHKVDFLLLIFSLVFSLLNFRASYRLVAKLSDIVTEGDKLAFLDGLLQLGAGMAPPSLIERLGMERTVIVDANVNLENLTLAGVRSIGRAIKMSLVLRQVEFKDTKLDSCISRLKQEGAPPDAFTNFLNDLCQNRTRLIFVAFDPAIDAEPPGKMTNRVLRLRRVINGSKPLLDVQKVEPSSLRRAVEINMWSPVARALEQEVSSDVVSEEAKWATRIDHWRALAALLAHREEWLGPKKGMLLHIAAKNGACSCMKLLIHARAELKGDEGKGALAQAAQQGNAGVVKELLCARADPNEHQKGQYPALHAACASRSKKVAMLLLQRRANVNLETEAPIPPLRPLDICATEGAPYIAKELIALRCEPNSMVDDQPPLVKAALEDQARMVRVLWKARANLEAREKKRGCTPLIAAASTGAISAARMLLQLRANPDAQDKKGATAMVSARKFGKPDVEELLRKFMGKLDV